MKISISHMFNNNKFPKLGALKDNAEPTAEELAAANSELEAAGISAFLVVATEDIPNATTLAARLACSQPSAAPEATEDTAGTQVLSTLEKLTTVVSGISNRLDALEDKPAASAASPADPKTKTESGDPVEERELTTVERELDALLKAKS